MDHRDRVGVTSTAGPQVDDEPLRAGDQRAHRVDAGLGAIRVVQVRADRDDGDAIEATLHPGDPRGRRARCRCLHGRGPQTEVPVGDQLVDAGVDGIAVRYERRELGRVLTQESCVSGRIGLENVVVLDQVCHLIEDRHRHRIEGS
ncbi:hypothetical protein [Allobranchiibius sp. GilTou73]|uniref:hypothetical protein n=1 Tax=Allobranchiibius sp. GilTou73 TaxID=2904523 RepID=UPI001F3DDBD2|nr:hypothetical protein [Allobranchiibius sp. GilTou73]UIJ34962.1 hypothetical protein LVQ62_00670 [Allobranchiibius sp. GilTou73]